MKKTLLVISLVLALSGCATGRETVSHYRWMGNPSEPHDLGELQAADAQCRWEVRQASMGRPQTPLYTGGYNDPQIGGAMAALGGALAATPGPGLVDACLAAKGWRLEFRQ
jgi:hypothetical protein